MESANYRNGNLLSPPHRSYFALHSHSNIINPRSSTPSATIISQAKPQPSFERERLWKKKPRSGNLRLTEDVPTIIKINKALGKITKSGNYGEALSHFNELQFKDIELDLYTFSIAINCYCSVNQVGFGFSLLGSIFKRGYTPNEVIFNTLLNGLVTQDKADEALSHFNKLQLQDIELNLYSFNIAINCYSRVNRVGFGFSLLGSIFKRGYTPNVVIFTTLLNGLIAQDKAAKALSLFGKLQLQDIELDLYTFSIAINCYCCVNRVGFGFSLLGNIFKRGYTPNVVIFNTLLKGLSAQDKVVEVLSHFDKLQLQDIELDLYTFHIAINCYCRMNRVGFGFSLLGSIFKRGYTPNEVIFSTLLSGLIIHDKTVDAVEFFEKIVKKGKFKPDESGYGSFINRLCKMGNTGAAISFLRIGEDGGLKPNTMTYSMIIDHLCKDGMVDDSVNFLLEMKSKGIRADVVTYNSLIDGLCKHGKWKEATGMLREMVNSGISPDVCTLNVVASALCKQGMTKEAEELHEDMIARGVDPDVVTYSTLMNGYCLQGLMDEAMGLLNAMVDRGIHPDSYCYNTLIKGYCKNMKLDEAMHLFREMPLRGLKRNIVTFNIIVRGLVQIGRYTAAQEILNQMQAACQIPDPKTCGLLLDGLCQSGHIDEAMFLFHMMKKRGSGLDIVKYNVLVDAYCKNKTLDNARDLFTVLPSKGSCPDDRTSLI